MRLMIYWSAYSSISYAEISLVRLTWFAIAWCIVVNADRVNAGIRGASIIVTGYLAQTHAPM